MAKSIEYIVRLKDQFSKSADKMSRSVGKINTGMTQLGVAGTAGLAALSAAATKSLLSFADFENSMLQVKSLLNDDSFASAGMSMEEGFAKMSDGVLSVMKEIPISMDAATTAMFDTVSAGVDAAGALDVLSTAGRLAVAGGTDVSTATDGITSALNAYGLAASDAEGVAAAFFMAQKGGKTTIAELAAGLGKVGSMANTMGVSLEETLAATSAITLGGVGTSEAYTKVQGVLKGILKPSSDAAKHFKKLGIEVGADALKNMTLAEKLAEIKEKTGGSADALGILFSDIEGLSGILSLTGKQQAAFNSILSESTNETKRAATFNRAYDEQVSSFSNQMGIAKNKVLVFSVTLGKKLAPQASKALGIFSDFMDKISEDKNIMKFIGKVASMAGVIGGASLAILGIKGAMMVIMPMFTVLAGVIGLLMSPIGIVIAGIGALGYAFAKFSGLGGALVANLKYTIGDLVNAIGDGDWDAIGGIILKGLGNALNIAKLGFKNILGKLGDVDYGVVGEKIKAGLATAIDLAIKGAIAGFSIAADLMNAISSSIDGVEWSNVGATVANGLIAAISLAFKGIKNILGGLWDAMTSEGAEGGGNAALNLATSIVKAIVSAFAGFAGVFIDLGSNIIGNIMDGIKTKWVELQAWLIGAIAGFFESLPSFDIFGKEISVGGKAAEALREKQSNLLQSVKPVEDVARQASIASEFATTNIKAHKAQDIIRNVNLPQKTVDIAYDISKAQPNVITTNDAGASNISIPQQGIGNNIDVTPLNSSATSLQGAGDGLMQSSSTLSQSGDMLMSSATAQMQANQATIEAAQALKEAAGRLQAPPATTISNPNLGMNDD